MNEVIVGFTAVAGTMTFAILLVYLFFTSRHKQRMRLIETGQSARIFNAGTNSMGLKLGGFFVGAGLGMFIGSILEYIGLPSETSSMSMIMIFSGLGLIYAHKMAAKEERAHRSYSDPFENEEF